MHDEFRLRVHMSSPRRLLSVLEQAKPSAAAADGGGGEGGGGGAGGDDGGGAGAGGVGRLAVTHDQNDVFLYADSLSTAQDARGVVERLLAEHQFGGEVTLSRWHPIEERWEDASLPLPASEQEQEAERALRDATEDAASAAHGSPEWEVRMTLPTHHDARTFAERLRGEGIPVRQHWRHLLVGANNEDEAASLAERLRGEAPAGSEIIADGNGLLYWQELHPYAMFGGMGA